MLVTTIYYTSIYTITCRIYWSEVLLSLINSSFIWDLSYMFVYIDYTFKYTMMYNYYFFVRNTWIFLQGSTKSRLKKNKHKSCILYGVPLGPLAISCLAFSFKNKNARFSHENSKRIWNLHLFIIAWLENARVLGRGIESATARL